MKFFNFFKDILKRFYNWIFRVTPSETIPIIPTIDIKDNIISINNTPVLKKESSVFFEIPSNDVTPREEESYRVLPQMKREPTNIERVLEKLKLF